MLEVEKIEYEGEVYLKLLLIKPDNKLINIIKSINGWFKGSDSLVYGLPHHKEDELKHKTRDNLVLWKGNDDNMGSIVKGIDTSNISTDYCVAYTPKLPLRPHQVVTFNLMLQRDNMIISDQEGVGKTPPILCSHEAKIQQGLIKLGLYVTKSSLLLDVRNQANRFTNLNLSIITGTKKKRLDEYNLISKGYRDLIVISYETLREDIEYISTLDIDVVYLDEAHKIKNPQSKIGKLIHSIECSQKYVSTATPIINQILDLYNIFNWLGLVKYNFYNFRNRYFILDNFNNPIGYKNLGEIKSILQSNMLRRLKTDVLKDLPPVVPKTVYCNMTPQQKRLYKQLEQSNESQSFSDLSFENIPTELVKFARLCQVAESCEIVGGESGKLGSGKLQELDELLQELLERGEKAIVFSRSKLFTQSLVSYFRHLNPSSLTGEMPITKRQSEIDRFQNDPLCKVIFCVESASREGWTGTSANNIIFTSKPFSPAYVSQCIGRAWRFGAEVHQSINVYTLLAKDTIDERVEMLLTDKQFIITNMVENPMTTKDMVKVLRG
jgi:SNF2 family DNA or RNA helicase